MMALAVLCGVCAGEHLATAQSTCEEPTAQDYLDTMDAMRNAIALEDYSNALELIESAMEQYDFVMLDYSRARALHRLERYEDAQEAYTAFLGSSEECDNVDDYRRSARDYRSLAIHDQLETSVEPEQDFEPIIGEESDDGIDPGWWVLGGGSVLLGVVFVLDFTNHDLIDNLDDARAAQNMTAFNQAAGDLEDVRTIEWIVLGSSIAAITTGLVLILTGSDAQDVDTTIGIFPNTTVGSTVFGFEF